MIHRDLRLGGDDGLANHRPPVATGLIVQHHHVGLAEHAGIPKGQYLVAQAPAQPQESQSRVDEVIAQRAQAREVQYALSRALDKLHRAEFKVKKYRAKVVKCEEKLKNMPHTPV